MATLNVSEDISGGVLKWYNHIGNWQFLFKFSTYLSCNPILVFQVFIKEQWKYMSRKMLISECSKSFIHKIAPKWKNTMSIPQGIYKQTTVYFYRRLIIRNKDLYTADMSGNLNQSPKPRLSDSRHLQKSTQCFIPFIWRSRMASDVRGIHWECAGENFSVWRK